MNWMVASIDAANNPNRQKMIKPYVTVSPFGFLWRAVLTGVEASNGKGDLGSYDVLDHSGLLDEIRSDRVARNTGLLWRTLNSMQILRPLEHYGDRNTSSNGIPSAMWGYTVGQIQPANSHCAARASVGDPTSHQEPVFFVCVSVVANGLQQESQRSRCCSSRP
jgi:hypothetical protein